VSVENDVRVPEIEVAAMSENEVAFREPDAEGNEIARRRSELGVKVERQDVMCLHVDARTAGLAERVPLHVEVLRRGDVGRAPLRVELLAPQRFFFSKPVG
jgi:hypothetical protein